ncbi:histidine phosphatase family protein [Ochrobactrum pecoris]|uniref:Histidine phosphatase family protein n=1 Tax=Brucella pecoris TaxID=867683 RepID=A0A5C5CIM8_9HYPH|nr:histidine phosphatase family protein [Brucella pecoris]MBB4094758.1 phosphohistidine phosphatase [Brucella pecoris]NKW80233.1 histidine phosphatase family protein [Brucella pecoris]TNV11299.1 histidine phosphatase family protein [Brucella pecoris]
MSRLLLLRHAKAMWTKPGMKDFDRPLDQEGKASLDRLARTMKSLELYPDLVVLSGSCRTRETAFGLIERLEIEVETIIDDTIYSGGAADYMQSIRKHGHAPTVMLVGHNPSMEDLALALCGDGNKDSLLKLRAGFPTAALANINFPASLDELEPGGGYLESFLFPQ